MCMYIHTYNIRRTFVPRLHIRNTSLRKMHHRVSNIFINLLTLMRSSTKIAMCAVGLKSGKITIIYIIDVLIPVSGEGEEHEKI